MAHRDFKLNMNKICPSTWTLSSHCAPVLREWHLRPSVHTQTGHLGAILMPLLFPSRGLLLSPHLSLLLPFPHTPLQSKDLHPLSLEGVMEEAPALDPPCQGLNPSCVILGKGETYLSLKQSDYKWKQKENQLTNQKCLSYIRLLIFCIYTFFFKL